MTENTINPDAPVTYVKGTWQDKMNKSATLLDRSTKARKQASSLLWDGAVEGIESWLPTADTDASAENFYGSVLDILGVPRKGDASKIKTVALAVKNNGLVLGAFPNLSKAYGEATRLTKTVKAQAEEDDAADKAVESITAPKTATTQESAAMLLLSKGVDGAVVAILDALGKTNEAAHRSFMRAVATEVAARVQAAKPKPAPKAAKVVKPKIDKAAPKSGATKAKPVPVSKSKGDPNKKALPAKAAKAKPAPKPAAVTEPVAVGDTVDNTPINDGVETSAPVVPVRRAVPVRR